MILLITNRADITSDFIVNGLNKEGFEYYRLNTEDIGSRVLVSFDLARNENLLWDSKTNRQVDLNKINSVYFRRPKLPLLEKEEMSQGEQKFVQSEFAYTLEGLYKILADRYWINNIYAIREAENKLYQLKLAQHIGLNIPDTIVTSIPNRASEFINSHGNCIVKPVKTGLIEDKESQKYIFTTELPSKESVFVDRVRYCPTLIQMKIDKAYDIRLTMVGVKIFPARINSQAFEETKVDWRKGDRIDLQYEKLDLPRAIQSKCQLLLEKLNLRFGAIDLVIDKNGKIYFLEINPNGQWAWIEKRLGYAISREIISLLMRSKQDHVKSS